MTDLLTCPSVHLRKARGLPVYQRRLRGRAAPQPEPGVLRWGETRKNWISPAQIRTSTARPCMADGLEQTGSIWQDFKQIRIFRDPRLAPMLAQHGCAVSRPLGFTERSTLQCPLLSWWETSQRATITLSVYIFCTLHKNVLSVLYVVTFFCSTKSQF